MISTVQAWNRYRYDESTYRLHGTIQRISGRKKRDISYAIQHRKKNELSYAIKLWSIICGVHFILIER